jgi:hypothetical protein
MYLCTKFIDMRLTHCEIGRIDLVEKNLLEVNIEAGTKVDVLNLLKFKNLVVELSRTEKLYGIFNCGAYSNYKSELCENENLTKEARELCENENMDDQFSAKAIIVHDLGQMIVAKHTFRLAKTNVPTRIFVEKKQAHNWLEEQRIKVTDFQIISK